MSVKISTTNSKLGLIPSVNLSPILTCRKNCPCSKDCYATKGRFRFQNVKQSMKNNYDEYLRDSNNYFTEIKHAINNGMVSYAYFRWHASGDIVNEKYFEGMVQTAVDLPNTKFLAFTKKFELVNSYIKNGGVIPQNLNIVFSAWGDSFKIENPYDFPIAHVRFHDRENKSIPTTALECSGDCTNCLQCWNIKKGQAVVFNKH